MSLLTYNIAGTITARHPYPPSQPPSRRTAVVAQARKGLSSSRTRRLEKLGKKSPAEEAEEQDKGETWAAGEGSASSPSYLEGGDGGGGGGGGGGAEVYSTGPMPDMRAELQPDFWEGPQWEALGFFVQYQWAFGIGFALIACGIAVATYNEGATDFKKTPVYKESVQSQELLEEPETSDSNVFEANPTEEAPSLE